MILRGTVQSAIYLSAPTTFPFMLECCLDSVNSFSIAVISCFFHSAEALCIFYQPNCPTVHVNLFDAHLFLLMN